MSAMSKIISSTPTAKQGVRQVHSPKERASSEFDSSAKKAKKLYRNYSQYINKSSSRSRKPFHEDHTSYTKFINKWKQQKSKKRKSQNSYRNHSTYDCESTVEATTNFKRLRGTNSYARTPNAVSTEYSQGILSSFAKPAESETEEEVIPDELDDHSLSKNKGSSKEEYSEGKQPNSKVSIKKGFLMNSNKKSTPLDEYTQRAKKKAQKDDRGRNSSYSNLMALLDQSKSIMSSFQDKKSSVAQTRSSVFKKNMKPLDKSPSALDARDFQNMGISPLRASPCPGMTPRFEINKFSIKREVKRGRDVKTPTLLSSRQKMAASREREVDGFIETADKILNKQK